MSAPPTTSGTAQIRYQRAGSGERVVVLLHGWPQHSLMWKRIIPELTAAGYTVIAPDLRGAGGSTITPDGYDKLTMAEDVRALVKSLGFKRVSLVGYDHGAGVAYSWAAAYPEEVDRVVFAEYAVPGLGFYEGAMTPNPNWNNGSNWQLAMFTVPDVSDWAFRGKERELLSWFFWHMSCDPGAVDPADFEEYVRQISKPGALRAGINYYAAVWKDQENNKRLLSKGKLKMPVLAVGGQCGFVGIANVWRPVAENVREVIIPNAGHWLTDENPKAFAQELITFLRENRR